MPNFKQIIKRILPKFLKNKIINICKTYRLIKIYIYDFKLFKKYSSTFYFDSNDKFYNTEALISAITHIIEKGLSFNETKKGFGQDKIKRLLALLEQQKNTNENSFEYQYAIKVIRDYYDYHKKINFPLNKELDKINSYQVCEEVRASTISLSKTEILDNLNENFLLFSNSRHSVRNFSEEEVDNDLIVKAIDRCRFSPCVCNRHTTKVYIVKEKYILTELLKLQKGNRGFTNVNKLLILTSITSSFHEVNESFLGYIDTGIFTMNLIYNLHFEGIATCPLAWCHPPEEDKKARKLLNLTTGERIIVFIAIGNYKATFKIPASNKKDKQEYFEVI